METPNLKVLLLGWDDTYPTQHPPAAPLGLARTLAAHSQLTVVLPTLPASTAPIAGVDVTAIGNLSAEELQAAVDQSRSAVTARAAWKTPAAPYLGATPAEEAASSPALQARVPAAGPSAAISAEASGSTFRPVSLLEEEESAGEPSAAEANALDEDMPLEPAVNFALPAEVRSFLPASAERTTPQHALAVLNNEIDDEAGLNFRVIQYARFATPFVADKPFEVIYAAEWPTWLAAMEIRQRTGRPLVLHVHSLCSDRNTTDDRGWIQELERLALRRADLIILDSEELCHRVRQLYNIPLHRTRVQHGEVNAEEVSRALQALL
ncbi:hypothetical protein PK28_13440 [Hymenobacter sp. DG25B]|uniref:glycosyltransferase n=1 Tax=Hymenobacter sp. DG25B TaxID=1385664 RepID=UPI0005409965|nr:glycosyltransferase [Hymenobacter sp. DG25B]AIZ64428.1 hypothetical protein PK28_13440 [Hymenobacter sp. DG25B]